jgi:hypothetical protein
VFVQLDGGERYNQAQVDMFYENALLGIPAFMRTMHYTFEGNPIITDYMYDVEVYVVTTDSSRDRFGARLELAQATYRYLVPYAHSRPYGAQTTYYLSNMPEIFTAAPDGAGTVLADGLGTIPSPSNEVG